MEEIAWVIQEYSTVHNEVFLSVWKEKTMSFSSRSSEIEMPVNRNILDRKGFYHIFKRVKVLDALHGKGERFSGRFL